MKGERPSCGGPCARNGLWLYYIYVCLSHIQRSMNPDQSPPDYVYRLAALAEWKEAQKTGRVPLREIDEKDGYIHLSTREQLLETARLHFPGARDLVALEIPLAPIAANVRFEVAPKRGEAFPHLYAPLEPGMVERVLAIEPDGDGFGIGDAL